MIVEFGATSKTLTEQKVPGACLLDNAYAADIDRLNIKGLLTDAEARRARQRLLRKISGRHANN